MMSRHFIVYKVRDEKMVLHDHPVFTGDVAYDLPSKGQDIAVDPELDVRLFSNEGEVITAVMDYIREETEPAEVEPWIVLTRYTVNQTKFKNNKSKPNTKL